MVKPAPDYVNYSYEELLDVHRHIDMEKFPERFEEVEELISSRAEEKCVTHTENSFDDKAVFGFMIGELLIWGVISALSLLGYSIL